MDSLVLVLLQLFLTIRDVFVKELKLVLIYDFFFFLITTIGYNIIHQVLLTISYLNKVFHNTEKHQFKPVM